MNADELTKLLDELASRLEGPARYAFELVVRQVAIEGVLMVGLSLVALVALAVGWFVGIRVARRRWADENARYEARKEKSSYYVSGPDGFGYWMTALMAGLGSIAALAVMVTGLYSGLLYLLNPEYAALSRLMEVIR